MKMGVCGLLKAIALYLLFTNAIKGEWTPSLHFILTTIHLQINRKSLCMYFMYTFCTVVFSFSCYTHTNESITAQMYTHTCFYAMCVILTYIDAALLDLQGPIFVHEPPYKIEFSNNTGGIIHCSGHANPYPEVIFRIQYIFHVINLIVQCRLQFSSSWV